MYFVTYGGLSVYDGTRFVNYTIQDRLPNDVINDVIELQNDTILIATNSNHLNMLVDGKIGNYPLHNGNSPLINRFLKSSDGNIYTASDQGLFVLAKNNFQQLPVKDKHGNDISLYLDKIIEWHNYLLIIPWDDRIERLILYDRVKRTTADVYPSSLVFGTKIDKNDNVWLTTYNGIKLLNPDSLRSGKISLINVPETIAPAKTIENYSYTPYFDRSGNIWLYTGNNIKKITVQGDVQIISPDHGLKSASILDLFEDREGIIWMATDGSGVIKMKGSSIQLVNSFTSGGYFSASSIARQEDTIWVYDKNDNSVLQYYHNAVKRYQLASDVKFGTIYLQNQSIYFVSANEVLTVTDKMNPLSYRHPQVIIYKSNVQDLGCAVTDQGGAFILITGGSDSGFYLSVYKDKKFVSRKAISFMSDKVLVGSQQRLWIAPRDNHISVFSLHPERPQQYLELIKDFSNELPDMSPRSITEDKQGNIWIGTRYNGVYKLELSGLQLRSIRQFSTRDGLTDNFVYSMACDNSNNIWIGTQSGLDKIFFKNGQTVISNISKGNGFFQAIREIQVTADNTVWALTSEGTILKVEQTVTPVVLNSPPLLLNLLEVNDSPVNDTITAFSHRQNNFSFNVAAPSFFDEKSILYSYQLEGSGNNKWTIPAHNPFLTFSNLSPGQYTLHARALFPDAIYPPQEASYSFTILPPWWQTVLFRLIAASAAILFLIIATRIYYRRKLRQQRTELEKQQAIEKERTRIATDMHDDLGAGLSRIKFLSETIGIKKQQQLPIEEDISKIREYSHQMIDKMGEIVWALNEKNDSLSDLLSYTRSYSAEYLSQNGIACTINEPEQLKSLFVSGELRRNVFLAVKEILHNIVKHSQSNNVVIDIRISDYLDIRLWDDGIGFDKTTIRPFSNGLTNIEKRMKDIGGKFQIQSANGTEVLLHIPLPG